jgi:hypothetical protein
MLIPVTFPHRRSFEIIPSRISITMTFRRVQASAKTRNAKVAADIERAAWNNLPRGAVGLPVEGPQKNITVSELLDSLKASYGDENTMSQQKRSLLKLARRAFGSKVANQLTSRDVENYITEKRKEGKKKRHNQQSH